MKENRVTIVVDSRYSSALALAKGIAEDARSEGEVQSSRWVQGICLARLAPNYITASDLTTTNSTHEQAMARAPMA